MLLKTQNCTVRGDFVCELYELGFDRGKEGKRKARKKGKKEGREKGKSISDLSFAPVTVPVVEHFIG